MPDSYPPHHTPITLPEIGGFRLVNAIGTPALVWEILGSDGDPIWQQFIDSPDLLAWAAVNCDACLFLEVEQ